MSWSDPIGNLIGFFKGGVPTLVEDTDPLPVIADESEITPLHKTFTSSGATIFVTPAAGKRIRLWWYNLGADPANGAHVIAALRFGVAGTDFYKTALSQYGAATAHSFKAGRSYHQGAVDESLYVNLSAAQTVYGNIDYEEV